MSGTKCILGISPGNCTASFLPECVLRFLFCIVFQLVYTGHESYAVTSFKNKHTISISQHLLAKITVLGKKISKEGTVSDLSSVAYMTR